MLDLKEIGMRGLTVFRRLLQNTVVCACEQCSERRDFVN
jgi:hypothetical protein